MTISLVVIIFNIFGWTLFYMVFLLATMTAFVLMKLSCVSSRSMRHSLAVVTSILRVSAERNTVHIAS